MAGAFDDLVPQKKASKGAFDDLIPSKPSPKSESALEYSTGLARAAAQGATFSFGDEVAAGLGSASNWLARKAGLDIPERTYGQILSEERGGMAAFSEANPKAALAAEVAGGIAVPVGAANALRAPTLAGRVGRSAAAGAGIGAVTGFGAGEGGLANRAIGAGQGALVGAVAAPVITEVVAPLVGRAVRTAGATARYARNALNAARDPEGAAINTIAERASDAGIDLNAIRSRVLADENGRPLLSNALQQRGVTEENLADIVSRGLNGEPPAQIAQDFGLSAGTVSQYVRRYRDANPTPFNLIDDAKRVAGEGGAGPITRLGRAAYGLAGDASGEAAQRLRGRQDTQAGRVGNIFERSVGGGDFEATRAAGLRNMEQEADRAYRQFYAEPELAINQLGDLMEEPLFRRLAMQAQRQERINIIRQNQDRIRNGQAPEPVPTVDPEAQVFSPRTLDYIQRELRLASQQGTNPNRANYARNMREVFLDRIEQHYPTFRDIRRNYADAQGQFGEEGALEAGAALTTKLGAPAREALRGFGAMTPAQQELFRLGFAERLRSMSANPQIGGAVANQFNTGAVREIVERIYPRNNATLWRQGQQLLRELQGEVTTTNTKNDVLIGARTAEYGQDMQRLQETAQTAANVVTGRWGKLLENLHTRLTTHLGQQGSREVLDILTQTDPAQRLQALNRLARAARTIEERRTYTDLIRQVRRDRTLRLITPSAEVPASALAPLEITINRPPSWDQPNNSQ